MPVAGRQIPERSIPMRSGRPEQTIGGSIELRSGAETAVLMPALIVLRTGACADNGSRGRLRPSCEMLRVLRSEARLGGRVTTEQPLNRKLQTEMRFHVLPRSFY